jgi:hypothetical protein
LDYRIIVAEDCCDDDDEEVHRVLTTKTFAFQAIVTPETTALLLAEPTDKHVDEDTNLGA